jgi:hypothetical protein
LATGVASWSTTAATNSSADSAVNWAEGQAPSSVNDSARAMMASVAKWRDDLSGAITTAGTSTAFTATTNQVFASLAALDNKIITIVPHTTSGAAPTLAVDGLTAKAINIATTVAVPTGYLVAGTPYVLYYEAGVGEFIVLNGNAAVLATSGTFSTTLGVTGAATFSSTIAVTGVSTFSDDLRAADGNATTPSYGFTNDTDCGWYRIGANNLGLALNGSKVVDAATTGLTITGTVACDTLTVSTTFSNAAAQADQETATATGKLVTPAVQHYHPSASKCWLKCDHAGNVNASYNITSITDTGAGVVTVTIATDFSSAHYALNVSVGTAVGVCAPNSSQAAGSFVINAFNTGTGAAQDSILGYYAEAHGDI